MADQAQVTNPWVDKYLTGDVTPIQQGLQPVGPQVAAALNAFMGQRPKPKGNIWQQWGKLAENIATEGVKIPWVGKVGGLPDSVKWIASGDQAVPAPQQWDMFHPDYHLGLPGGGDKWTWNFNEDMSEQYGPPDPRPNVVQDAQQWHYEKAHRKMMEAFGANRAPRGFRVPDFWRNRIDRFKGIPQYGRYLWDNMMEGINDMSDFRDYHKHEQSVRDNPY